jgi:hypothetical protein
MNHARKPRIISSLLYPAGRPMHELTFALCAISELDNQQIDEARRTDILVMVVTLWSVLG